MSLTPPPTAPAPTDSTEDFDTHAFSLVAWFATFVTEMTAEIANMVGYVATALGYANAAASSASAAATSATASGASATAAAGSATAAAASAAVTTWITGTTYAQGARAMDPGDSYNIYTRIVAGAGSTQPHSDATNWRLSFPQGKPLAVVAVSAVANIDFLNVFTAAYDGYLIEIDGLAPGSDDVLKLRFANGGSVDSGSDYFSSPTPANFGAAVTSVPLNTGSVTSAGKGVSGSIQIQNANAGSGSMKAARAATVSQTAAAPTYTADTAIIGYIGGAISGFRLFWSGGANFAAQGTVRVYGYSVS